MNSKIYRGFVEHQRYEPQHHRFRFPIYMYGLFLDELEKLSHRVPLFGYNRYRLSAIHDDDYLHSGEGSILQKLKTLLSQHGIDTTPLRVLLVTAARYLNYVFNPVSFYCCLTPENKLACVVAEVNNTYSEKHLYVLDTPQIVDGTPATLFSAKKAFHVSPFNDLEGTYQFSFSDLLNELDIRIELIREGKKVFDARLWGKPDNLTSWNHIKTLARHPMTAHMSIPRIYREAFRLYFRKNLAFIDKPVPESPMTIRSAPATSLEKVSRRLTLALLSRITKGKLEIQLPGGEKSVFGNPRSQQTVQMTVKDNTFFTRLVLSGEIGLGESYMQGEWDSPDLVALFKLFIDNRSALAEGNMVTSAVTVLAERIRHKKSANTIHGSHRNVSSHYDLGNDFYQLFLDETMTYSCAVFDSGEEDLKDAQRRKMNMIIRKAGITAEDHVLEIGCGWGGFAVEAARSTGCRVTGITVSPAQHRYATERIRKEGLSGRVTILQQDYRELRGQFDKIVSIEMLEAVGHENFGTFFRRCDALLKPHGKAVIQSITIPDQLYRQYSKTRDWIQKHIFPGGHLPSITVLTAAMTRHSSLMLEDLENIGIHYTLTLKNWRLRFLRHVEEAKALGFDAVFIRKWIYYLSICEAGFEKKALGDVQMVLSRPGVNSQ